MVKKVCQYTFYIGADNVTGIVDSVKIREVVSQYADGFTFVDTLGYWKGTSEASAVVTIIADKLDWRGLQAELVRELKQEAVYVTRNAIEVL
jgi:hypothetical protein